MIDVLNVALILLGSSYIVLFAFLCRVQRSSKSHEGPGQDNAACSGVSIVITARNEAARIRNCLLCLEKLTYPKSKYEIIFVDDGSMDGTEDIIKEFLPANSNWRLLRFAKPNGARGIMPSMDYGIQSSRNDIILRTDADCEVNRDWIQAMIGKFDSHTSMMIGFCHLRIGKGLMQGFLGFDNLVSGLLNGSFARLGFPIGCSGGNMAFRKTCFQSAGGFTSMLTCETGEDTHLAQLFHRYQIGKIKHCLIPESIVSTYVPDKLSDIVSRMIRVNSETFKMNAIQCSVRLVSLAAYVAPFILVFNGRKLIGISLITLRYLIEHVFLRIGANSMRRKYPLIPNVIYQILYPVYLIGFGLAGVGKKKKWR